MEPSYRPFCPPTSCQPDRFLPSIIHAYPQGGGAYMVTRENLSPELGLIAGGSLLVDYMLTVAVSVSSGADAITAALPALHPYNLHISIFSGLALLMLLNLRGV